MSVLDKAILFAVNAHAGAIRKDGVTPYILHPMEAAVIASSVTKDPDVLAAALLHDTVEDTSTTIEEIEATFGARVAALVASETENKRPEMSPVESWQIRKEESLNVLKNADDIGVKVLWLSDKLSNMRSLYRMAQKEKGRMWTRFHQSDPARQARYYRAVAAYTSELSNTEAWIEYNWLTEKVFEGVN